MDASLSARVFGHVRLSSSLEVVVVSRNVELLRLSHLGTVNDSQRAKCADSTTNQDSKHSDLRTKGFLFAFTDG